MNDLRVEAFLQAVRTDLGELFPRPEAEERMAEIAGHLELSIAERLAAGEPDPVAAALADFGDPHGYRQAAAVASDGLLLRRPERTVVRLAALCLLVPIGLDLLMDASSWLTGSESSLIALSLPVTVLLLLRFTFASTLCRRFLFAPLTALTIGCFALYLGAGSWTRATDAPGGIGTQPRGTAYQRRNWLEEKDLPLKEARLASVERAARLFAQPGPTAGIGEFRAAAGYLVPTISSQSREALRHEPRSERWLLDDVRYVPVADYAAARDAWKEAAPETVRLAQRAVQGDREEIESLSRIVSCPWTTAVAAEQEPKSTMGMVALVCLLFLHGLGVASGATIRRLRRRRFA